MKAVRIKHRIRREGLWRDRNFVKLWTGQTISFFGSHVTAVALPLTAALYLDATPAQMGLLVAAGSAPYLFFSLLAGVWIDRRRRRPILVGTNLVRALLLGAIPALYLLGLLNMAALVAVAALVGGCGMLFDLAYQSYLPSLVEPDDLTEGNSKLWASRAVADVGGPGMAGLLVGLLTAPFALLLDALSFVASAASLARIRRPEPSPAPAPRALRREVGEGVRFTFRNPLLRAGALAAATYNFWFNVSQAVLVLYVVKQLGMSAGLFGLAFSVGALGALASAALSAPLARRYGVGPTIVGSAALSCTAQLLVPFIDDATAGAVLLSFALFLGGLGLTSWNVQIEVLQQTTVPNRLLGRMNATYLLLSLGAGSVGALLGGFLGGEIGLRPALALGAAGLSLAWLWLLFSPLRTLRELPAQTGPAEKQTVTAGATA